MTNKTAFRGAVGSDPENGFELFLDFSKPPLLDANNFVSAPTANSSNLSANGSSESWVASIFEAVEGVLRHKATKRSFIHRGFAYDIGMFLMAIPMCFYISGAIAGAMRQWIDQQNGFLVAAFYVYIFLSLLFLYRILFGYTKWAFPTVELAENNDRAIVHRVFWGAIILALAGNALWSILVMLGSADPS